MPHCVIPNGSFEIDSNSDGVPDDWERGLYPGGEGGYDTNESAHGARSYRFVHPGGRGNGGGYLESGFFPANRLFFPPLRFACRASASGVKVACVLRCHDAGKAFLGEREVYASVSNPAAWTLVVVTNVSGVPDGTEFVKVRLIGGKDDTDAAGTVWFDAVGVEGLPGPVPLGETVDQPAAKTRSGKYVDVGEAWDIDIPSGGKLSWLVVEVEMAGNFWSDEMSHGTCRPGGRFRVGERVSSEAVGPDAPEWKGPFLLSLNIEGVSGARQLRFQLRADPGGERAVSLRSPASLRRFYLPNTRVVDVGAGTVTDGWGGVRERPA